MLRCFFFQYMNNKKRIRSEIEPVKNNPSTFVTIDQCMARILNNYFSSVLNSTAEADYFSTNEISTTACTPATTFRCTMHNLKITTQEVLKAFNDIKTNKSPAPDNIYLTLINQRNSKFKLFDALCWGLVPEEWKTTNATLDVKTGDRSTSGNYRPISFICSR